TPVRMADRANDSFSQVCLSINKIQYFTGVMPHHQPVDREIAPLHVLLGRACINYLIRMTPVRITHIGTERGNLDLPAVDWNENHSKLRADRHTVRKHLPELIGRSVGSLRG